MDLQSVIGSNTIKYLLIGAVAAVTPALISKFLPGMSGLLLAGALVLGGVFLMGKVPIIPQALIAGAGIMFLAPMISGLIGGITGGAVESNGATF